MRLISENIPDGFFWASRFQHSILKGTESHSRNFAVSRIEPGDQCCVASTRLSSTNGHKTYKLHTTYLLLFLCGANMNCLCSLSWNPQSLILGPWFELGASTWEFSYLTLGQLAWSVFNLSQICNSSSIMIMCYSNVRKLLSSSTVGPEVLAMLWTPWIALKVKVNKNYLSENTIAFRICFFGSVMLVAFFFFFFSLDSFPSLWVLSPQSTWSWF